MRFITQSSTETVFQSYENKIYLHVKFASLRGGFTLVKKNICHSLCKNFLTDQ